MGVLGVAISLQEYQYEECYRNPEPSVKLVFQVDMVLGSEECIAQIGSPDMTSAWTVVLLFGSESSLLEDLN